MSTLMTHIDYTDAYATVPGSDDGIGATIPLNESQRSGFHCIDCDCGLWGGRFAPRRVGSIEGRPASVCQSCYEQRLFDHIDYYRPQS